METSQRLDRFQAQVRPDVARRFVRGQPHQRFVRGSFAAHADLIYRQRLQDGVEPVKNRKQSPAALGRASRRQQAQRAVLRQPRPFPQSFAETLFDGYDIEPAQQADGFSRLLRRTYVQDFAQPGNEI